MSARTDVCHALLCSPPPARPNVLQVEPAVTAVDAPLALVAAEAPSASGPAATPRSSPAAVSQSGRCALCGAAGSIIVIGTLLMLSIGVVW